MILPAGPLPETCARSTPSARCATRAATGETLRSSGTVPAAGALGADALDVCACAAPSAPSADCGAGAAACSPTAIRAITWPTVTVSPSCASSSATVPLAGAGSSTSTLSVEISTIVSLALIEVADLRVPFEDRALA